MSFGKRVPKKRASCCATCTVDSNEEVSKYNAKVRTLSSEDHKHLYKDSSQPRKVMRRCSLRERIKQYDRKKDQVERKVSLESPSEWLQDLSTLHAKHTVDKPNSSIFEILENHMSSSIPLNDVGSSDLVSLVGNTSISSGIITKIADMLNIDEASNNYCLSFNCYFKDEKVVRDVIRNKAYLEQLIMYLVVDLDEYGETEITEFVDNDSCHYTLAVYDFESLTLIYADTLGWSVPEEFVSSLKSLLASLDYPSVFHTILCHSPNNLDIHACVKSCSPLYPLQTSSVTSCLAVIVCMVIASVHFDTFLTLAMGVQTHENSYFHYLQDISDHSKFLRLIIGSWIANDCINLNYIACCSKMTGFQGDDTLPNNSEDVHKTNINNNEKSYLRSNVKMGPKLSNFGIGEFKSTSSGGIDALISCRPVVHFCKPNHLRLKLSLKDGRSLYKMFKSSGKNDRTAMRNIVEFLNSYKAVEWIKSKTFRNPSKISSHRLRKNKTCNIIDFPDDIQEYFIKNPELSFERKIMYLVLRVYIRGCSSIMTKKFSCSPAGKNDRAAIKRINAYVRSQEFRDFVVNSARTEQKLPEEKLSHAEFDDLILKKPLIHHIKDKNILKLECQLLTGKKVYRGFACSQSGKGDTKAMSAIEKFVNSVEATEWLRSKYRVKPNKNPGVKRKEKVPRDDNWTACGALHVGSEVKNFFETVEFDFRKRVVMSKGVSTCYEGNAIITENEKWGKTHRFDESYILDESLVTEKGVFPAVTMYVTCSSKSRECKAQCGTLLKAFANTVIGTECPGCHAQLHFPDKECNNCLCSSTPKWYSINNELYCSACYQYQQKHNEARPSELNIKNIQSVSRLYHPHFVCGWRLKLVIYSNNMSVWNLFMHRENPKFHSTKHEEIEEKPNISQLNLNISAADSTSKCQKVIIRSRDNKSILCNRCISENVSPPFTCTSQTELMKHMSTAHKFALINCATCWSESGALVNFENEHQLQQHIQESHKINQRLTSDTGHERDQDSLEATTQVEIDEAVIALLDSSQM
ncbi:hypothetical protein SK128_026661 [Halocaridina rubra]|uniref:GATA-type domain-containing protein n=1 Tax=Halocaridina rubra TaxID=373956 RepID=A0AAN8XN31_HALRR